MKRKAILVGILLTVMSSGSAFADVSVTLSKNTRDARRMAAYIENLGERHLKPGQNLKVQILEYRPGIGRDPWFSRPYGFGYGWHGYRYGPWNDPFWFDRFDRSRAARLKVSYVFTEKGKPTLSGTETIRGWGSGSLSRFGGSAFSDDRDEVRRWFRKRFVQREAAS